MSLLGTMATTLVTGTAPADQRVCQSGGCPDGVFPVGTAIVSPFEAGFGARQDGILEGLGCTNPADGYLDGGLDVGLADRILEHSCGVTMGRQSDGSWLSVLDSCGGHTREYHFHHGMACLDGYDPSAATGGHSPRLALAGDGAPDGEKYLYGKWEDQAAQLLPELDACGGHFGATPDSGGQEVYHYHAQDRLPYTLGCYGPAKDGGLVSVAECRSLYPECGDDATTYTTAAGDVTVDLYCPCYDANEANVGDIVELPATASRRLQV